MFLFQRPAGCLEAKLGGVLDLELVFTLALHKSRLMAISRSFQSRQVMQQFLLDRLIG